MEKQPNCNSKLPVSYNQVVGLRPEDLEAAVTEAVRQAVTQAVNRAKGIMPACQTSCPSNF